MPSDPCLTASLSDQGPDEPLKGQFHGRAHHSVQQRITQAVEAFNGPSHHGSGADARPKVAQALQSADDFLLADRVWFLENQNVASDGIRFDVADRIAFPDQLFEL